MTQQGMISADSHVIEPPDLFTRHIDARYRDRAPHIERDRDGTVLYVIGEGVSPMLPGISASAARLGQSMEEARRMG